MTNKIPNQDVVFSYIPKTDKFSYFLFHFELYIENIIYHMFDNLYIVGKFYIKIEPFVLYT